MKRADKNLLIALCMGDGHLRRYSEKSKTATLCIRHSKKQKDYLVHKANLINSFLGGKQSQVKDFDNSGYPGCAYYKSDKYFRIIYNWLYKDGKKCFPQTLLNRLDKRCIAYLWMDDGSLTAKKRNGKVHAWVGFLNLYEDYEVCERFANVFNTLFGIKPLIRKSKNSYRLEFNTSKCREFLPQIEEFVIPSLKYKVTMIR